MSLAGIYLVLERGACPLWIPFSISAGWLSCLPGPMGTLFIKALNDSPVLTTNSQGGVGRADAACSLATIPFSAPRQPQLQVLGLASFRFWEVLRGDGSEEPY